MKTKNHLVSILTVNATELLARAFARCLQEELGESKLHDIVDLNNGKPESGICHSGDACDSNMVMLRAWEETFVEECNVVGRDGPSRDRHTDLWNAAWTEAKAAGFYTKPPYHYTGAQRLALVKTLKALEAVDLSPDDLLAYHLAKEAVVEFQGSAENGTPREILEGEMEMYWENHGDAHSRLEEIYSRAMRIGEQLLPEFGGVAS